MKKLNTTEKYSGSRAANTKGKVRRNVNVPTGLQKLFFKM